MKAYVFQTLFLNYAIYFLLKMDRSLGVTNRLEKWRVHLIATYYELKKKPTYYVHFVVMWFKTHLFSTGVNVTVICNMQVTLTYKLYPYWFWKALTLLHAIHKNELLNKLFWDVFKHQFSTQLQIENNNNRPSTKKKTKYKKKKVTKKNPPKTPQNKWWVRSRSQAC